MWGRRTWQGLNATQKMSKPTTKRGRPPKHDCTLYLLCCRWEGCDQQFNTTTDARRHEMDVHFDLIGPVHYCRIGDCRMTFKAVSSYKRHFSIHQPKQYHCWACDESFHTSCKLSRHMKSSQHGRIMKAIEKDYQNNVNFLASLIE